VGTANNPGGGVASAFWGGSVVSRDPREVPDGRLERIQHQIGLHGSADAPPTMQRANTSMTKAT
jgi:hypothetical protein